MNKKPRPWARTIAYIVLILIAFLVYAYGWKVTDINLEKPRDPQRQAQVSRALHGLLNPDLVECDTESQFTQAYFLVPCTDTPPAQPEVAEGQPYITLSAYCGAPRAEIVIEGFNFRPHTEGRVRWTPPGSDTARSLGAVRTDASPPGPGASRTVHRRGLSTPRRRVSDCPARTGAVAAGRRRCLRWPALPTASRAS